MANVLCVLYDDPVDGYPRSYARDGIPRVERYFDGQATPTPERVDFTPGALLGSVSGELGLRGFLEERGHRLVVTSDKDGPDSVFERELAEAEIVISQPFWPAYLTAERIAKAPRLKLAVTAGIGSDHVDLQAAIERGITVAEVTYCNSISVAEHVVMMILALVRNYIPSYQWVVDGGWNIADCVSRAYDLEAMAVGTVGAGRIGTAVSSTTFVASSVSRSLIIGPKLELSLGRRWSLEVDALHRPLRSTVTEFFSPPIVLPNGTVFTNLAPNTAAEASWEIPVLGRYRLSVAGWNPFVEAGPSFRPAASGTNVTHFGVTAGAGVELHAHSVNIAPGFVGRVRDPAAVGRELPILLI